MKTDDTPHDKRVIIKQILNSQRNLRYFMIIFFFFTITTQSFISYASFISIRVEFGLQAIYYFGTLICMIVFT
jgi:hypothetical protein